MSSHRKSCIITVSYQRMLKWLCKNQIEVTLKLNATTKLSKYSGHETLRHMHKHKVALDERTVVVSGVNFFIYLFGIWIEKFKISSVSFVISMTRIITSVKRATTFPLVVLGLLYTYRH